MLSGGHVFSLFGHPRMTPADRLREHFSIGEHASARTRRSRRLAWSTAGTLSFPFPAFSIASQRRSALLECGVETTYTGHTRRCSPAAVAFSRTVLLVLASYTAQLTYNASTPTHTEGCVWCARYANRQAGYSCVSGAPRGTTRDPPASCGQVLLIIRV